MILVASFLGLFISPFLSAQVIPLCVIQGPEAMVPWVGQTPNGPWVLTTVYAPGNTIKADGGDWTLINNWVNPVVGNFEARLYRCFVNSKGKTIVSLYDEFDRHPTLGSLGGKESHFMEVKYSVPLGESGAYFYRVDWALYFTWFDANYYDPLTGQIGRDVVLGLPLAESQGGTLYFHQPGYGPPAGQ